MLPLYDRVRLHGHYYGLTSLVGTYLCKVEEDPGGVGARPGLDGGPVFHTMAHAW